MSFETSNDASSAARRRAQQATQNAGQPVDTKPLGTKPAAKAGPTMARPTIDAAGDGAERVTSRPRSAAAVIVDTPKGVPALLTDVAVPGAQTAPGGNKLADGALGVVFVPFAYLAYAIALSGRNWSEGKTFPNGRNEDVLATVRKYFWRGLNPLLVTYRAVQGVCLPAAGLGKLIDFAVGPFRKPDHDTERTFSGLPRTVLGYTGTAIDAGLRVVLSPAALLGAGIHAISATASDFFKIAPGVIKADGFYPNVGRVVGVGARSVVLPLFAMGDLAEGLRFLSTKIGYKAKLRNPDRLPSYWRVAVHGIFETIKTPFALALLTPSLTNLAFDAIKAKLTGKEAVKRGFWAHAALGTLHSAEVTFALPAVPLAGVGTLVNAIGPKLAEACGFKAAPWDLIREGDSLRKRYWKNAAVGVIETVAFPFRIAALPFAFGSQLYDRLTATADKPIAPETFWRHTARGVVRTVEGTLYVPLAPIAGFGKLMDWACRKTAAACGFTARAPMYRDDLSLRRKYWRSVREGVTEFVKLPFRVVGMPFAGVSALYEPSVRYFGLDGKDFRENRQHGFWYQAFRRGPMLTVVGGVAAVGGIVSGAGKLVKGWFGGQVDPETTLWGHKRSWGGFAIDAVDSAGRAVGAPFYAADYLMTRQLNFTKAPDDARSFYWRSGRGILRTVGSPLIAVGAVAGAAAWGFDAATGKNTTRDRSMVGLASDAMVRTWSGFSGVYDAYLKDRFEAASAAFAKRTARVRQALGDAYNRSVKRVTGAVMRLLGQK